MTLDENSMTKIPLQSLETIFLDMDGTLLDLHFDNFFWLHYLPEQYAQKHNKPLDESTALLQAHMTTIRGQLEWYDLDYWSAFLAMDIVALKNEIKNKISILPTVLDTLSTLKNFKADIVLLTNAHPKGVELKLNETGIGSFFDTIISSHELKAPKEDSIFWQRLLKHFPYRNATTLFVDDNIDVLQAAKDSGITYLAQPLQPDTQQPIKTIDDRWVGLTAFSDLLR